MTSHIYDALDRLITTTLPDDPAADQAYVGPRWQAVSGTELEVRVLRRFASPARGA